MTETISAAEYQNMIRINIKPLSVNEAFKGRKFRTTMYDVFQKKCMWLLPKLKVPDGRLELVINFGFSSSGSDIDNALKQTIDTLSKKYGFNDNKIYRLIVTKEIVSKGDEYFEFELIEIK